MFDHKQKNYDYTKVLCCIIQKMNYETHQSILDKFVDILTELFSKQTHGLEIHQNAQTYKVLSNLLSMDGYFLDSPGCSVCSNPEVPYTTVKLETLKQETKFTDSAQIVLLDGHHEILSFTISVSEVRKPKFVKTINFYQSTKSVLSATELKNNWRLWRKVGSITLSPGQNQAEYEFYTQTPAVGSGSGNEKLQCPRCSRAVTDRHGI
eukprot:c20589_g2_i1.p1 GENE.c20589_g2_i1~~c20589_g2_i1.p1  ORF type:complete len:208 (-),score=82.35 c20589_g2_i1:599-1222(-)